MNGITGPVLQHADGGHHDGRFGTVFVGEGQIPLGGEEGLAEPAHTGIAHGAPLRLLMEGDVTGILLKNVLEITTE